MSARGLSLALGLSEAYIYNWEHDVKCRPNREVLERVAELLQVTPHERKQLFQLAAARDAPPTAKHLYETSPAEQIALNVAQALTEIEHQLPENIPDQGESLRDLSRCAGWLFTSYAEGALGYTPERFKWPNYIYDQRIVDPQFKASADLALPADLVTNILPRVQADEPLTKPLVQDIGLAMADVVRLWFLSDLDRCRLAARALRRWSLQIQQDTGPVVSFTFRDVDDETFTVRDVSVGVVAAILRRDLAFYTWETATARDRHDFFSMYPARSDVVDSLAYAAFHLASLYLESGQYVSRASLQRFRDASFILNSTAWSCIETVNTFIRLALDSELTGVDVSSFPSDAVRAFKSMDFIHQALAYPLIDELRSRMLDILERAERRMSRELDRAESPLPTRSQSGKHKVQPPKKTAKRKTAKKRKRKPKDK